MRPPSTKEFASRFPPIRAAKATGRRPLPAGQIKTLRPGAGALKVVRCGIPRTISRRAGDVLQEGRPHRRGKAPGSRNNLILVFAAESAKSPPIIGPEPSRGKPRVGEGFLGRGPWIWKTPETHARPVVVNDFPHRHLERAVVAVAGKRIPVATEKLGKRMADWCRPWKVELISA